MDRLSVRIVTLGRFLGIGSFHDQLDSSGGDFDVLDDEGTKLSLAR